MSNAPESIGDRILVRFRDPERGGNEEGAEGEANRSVRSHVHVWHSRKQISESRPLLLTLLHSPQIVSGSTRGVQDPEAGPGPLLGKRATG
jgi:hypothetical protein